MGQRTGKSFIGGYIKKDTKAKLNRVAKAQDRSLSYLIEKILESGVKHLEEQAQLKKAA